ncbi:MAG: hypothetical protein ABF812_08670 [Gluconobacter cerinus]|uniref:hypothetical protein n=1 Tax=Gluconobacter cerinus TaxID=38307 RepID=UPI0039E796CB
MSYVQTATVLSQSASEVLGGVYPTSVQPSYASRFDNALENLAEGNVPSVPFLSTAPVAADEVVTLGRSLSSPVALQTAASQSADMTLMFVARLPNAPTSGNGNIGVMGATFYNSNSLNGWNGLMFGIGSGNALLYLCNDVNGSLSTQYAGATIIDAQAQAWGLYVARISSSGGTGIAATIQALTAKTWQAQHWSGSIYSKSGETPTVMLGADYLSLFGTTQSIQLKRGFVWNAALSDADIAAMAALIRTDLAADGVIV